MQICNKNSKKHNFTTTVFKKDVNPRVVIKIVLFLTLFYLLPKETALVKTGLFLSHFQRSKNKIYTEYR